MSANWSEADLREALLAESRDVASAEGFRARLVAVTPRREASTIWLALAAVAVLVVLLAGGRALPWLRTGGTADPASQPTSVLHTMHLALAPLPHYRVTLALDLGDREELQVRFEPGQASYDGGVVTLYAPGVFDASLFRVWGPRTGSLPRGALVGSYPYSGVWGPVSTVAWPLPDGRWVSVQNFTGNNDPESRAREALVASAVVVR